MCYDLIVLECMKAKYSGASLLSISASGECSSAKMFRPGFRQGLGALPLHSIAMARKHLYTSQITAPVQKPMQTMDRMRVNQIKAIEKVCMRLELNCLSEVCTTVCQG